MSNKMALVYNGKDYQIVVNEEVIATLDKLDEAYQCFEKTLQNNQSALDGNWETMLKEIKELEVEGVELFEAYSAIQYKTIKYFHNTGKLFYMKGGDMFPLDGGCRLLLFLIQRVAQQEISESEDFIELCAEASKKGIQYRIKESSFTLASPIFNYGYVAYNFLTQEIHKGTHTEKDTFKAFKQYVEGVIGTF